MDFKADAEKIEALAVHVDQLLLSHQGNGTDWLPIPKSALEDIQEILSQIRPGRPAEDGSTTPAATGGPPAPPLPGGGSGGAADTGSASDAMSVKKITAP